MELALATQAETPWTRVTQNQPCFPGRRGPVCMRELVDVIASVGENAKDWLHEAELRAWRRMTNGQRSDSFLAGRVLAKRILCAVVDEPIAPRQLLIVSPALDRNVTGIGVFCGTYRLPWQVSLSHHGRFVGAVLFHVDSSAMGLDIVDLADADGARLSVWMSDEERRDFPGDSATVCWSIKEAAFKALGRGTRFEPKLFRVESFGQQSHTFDTPWRTCNEFRWTFRGREFGFARVWSRPECVVTVAELRTTNPATKNPGTKNPGTTDTVSHIRSGVSRRDEVQYFLGDGLR